MSYPALRRILISSLLVGAFHAGVVAQNVDGRVIGLDGKAEGATVSVLDPNGDVMGEILVADNGRFSYEGRMPIGSVVVRQEAVVVTRGVVGGAATQLAIDLPAAVQWAKFGAALDPDGAPAVGLDLLARDARGRTLACLTTDERGMFQLRGSQPVADLLVDPLGWQEVVAVGFDRETLGADTAADVVVDMRPHVARFVKLQGKVVALDGSAVAGARVIASRSVNDSVTPCGFSNTAADGSFKLWTIRDATTLTARKGAGTWVQRGDWSNADSADVLLHENRDGLVMVAGVVLHADGKQAKNAIIYASDTAKLTKGTHGLTGTWDDGRFYAIVRRGTPFLIAVLREDGGTVSMPGPWPQPQLEMRAAKK